MASQDEIRSRVQFCLQLVQQGIDVSSATFLAQEQFDVSQRTAYRYVKAAEELIEQEDDAPAEAESTPEQRLESMVKLAEMRTLRALQLGDAKEMTAAVRALDTLKKHCGYSLQMQKGAATDVPWAVARQYNDD